MTEREREAADVKAAEGRQVHGTSVRSNNLKGNSTGIKWSDEAESAVKELGEKKQGMLSLVRAHPSLDYC